MVHSVVVSLFPWCGSLILKWKYTHALPSAVAISQYQFTHIRSHLISHVMHTPVTMMLEKFESTVKEEIFVGEKFRAFPFITFRMEFNFVLSE